MFQGPSPEDVRQLRESDKSLQRSIRNLKWAIRFLALAIGVLLTELVMELIRWLL